MRKIISFVLVLTLLQSFQCENDNQNDVITEEMLNNKRTEITNYIGQFTCSATSSCNFIPLGSKPCGLENILYILKMLIKMNWNNL